MNRHDDAHESANRVDDDLRLDKRAHFPDVAPTKSRCALCGKTTVNFCVKRNVLGTDSRLDSCCFFGNTKSKLSTV